MMLEELERRNYSQSTVRAYVRTVEDIARYFKRSPDQLGPEQIREYQAYLFRERKLAPNTVNQRTGALRFFFIATLKRAWSIAETAYPRKVFRLPKILSPEQVSRLIDAAPTVFYRMLLMTLYATGLRRAELARLKISDIDSERMVLHVKGGKGRKDRDVMLSPKLLEELRQYWRGLRRKPKEWLFPGNRWHTGKKPISAKVIWQACSQATKRAGLGDVAYLSLQRARATRKKN
jgi:site-specific recombinase XerD